MRSAFVVQSVSAPDSILLITRDEAGLFYWENGSVLFEMTEDWKQLKSYGAINSPRSWRRTLAAFNRDYPPIPYDLAQMNNIYLNGWLDVEGKFYRVGAEKHDFMARRIAGSRFPEMSCKHGRNPMCPLCAREYLIGYGYILLNNGVFYAPYTTEKQRKALRFIARQLKEKGDSAPSFFRSVEAI